jgi:hypothetical protein
VNKQSELFRIGNLEKMAKDNEHPILIELSRNMKNWMG